jgi:hypothetical protein
MPKIPIIVLTIVVTFLLLWAASAVVSALFVTRARKRLQRSVGREAQPTFSRSTTANLPEPVQRYFQYALKEGQPNIRYAELQQTARFRHRESSPWISVRAREVVSAVEPGFVWDAVLKHHTLWWRTAKLSYFQEEGTGHIKLFGAFTLNDYSGPETNASMLFRCLTEQVWLPTGLLPMRTLSWHYVDSQKAKAVIRDGETTVEAMFFFNDIGQIERITTDNKYRDYKSGFEQASFTMICENYREVEGMMVPLTVRFVWNTERGDFEYGVFDVIQATYTYH